MQKLGKLQEVDIRSLWKHEQYDFSNWLAKAENIEYLNDVLGLTLINVDKEVYVGGYRCDLVAEDETTKTKVIIENQLDVTNHDHLGKIITYASGLDAQAVVWIVKEAREEHRSAIEWLNNMTSSDINFFLLEIHAYRIGDSNPAPKFEVIEKPNDFIKSNKAKFSRASTKAGAESFAFWTEFNDVLVENGKPFSVRKATTDHWYNVALGKSGVHVDITLVERSGYIGVGIYIDDDKDLYDKFFECKDEIEEKLNFKLEWDRLDDKKASRIKSSIPGLSFDDHSNYKALMEKVIERAVIMRDTFKKYL